MCVFRLKKGKITESGIKNLMPEYLADEAAINVRL